MPWAALREAALSWDVNNFGTREESRQAHG